MKNKVSLERVLALEATLSTTPPSVSNNPYQFHSQQREASSSNANEPKEYGNCLKITKEMRGWETVYEFNLTGLWQSSDESKRKIIPTLRKDLKNTKLILLD